MKLHSKRGGGEIKLRGNAKGHMDSGLEWEGIGRRASFKIGKGI